MTSQEVQNPATVVSMVVGGAHGRRGSSIEHSKLAQPKAKDGDSVKELDNLHAKVRAMGWWENKRGS